ncbi:MAG: polysaccharide biosynthesis/export family protein [Candidatus Azobacteroides sp.]|nr:polysaccharide biosynthesis/export family protein [Candidatus Azobacteroides sp.]
MKRIIINILIVSQILFFSSCLTTRQTNLLQKPGGSIPSYPKAEELPEEYRVKIGDQLKIVVATNPMDKLTTQLFGYFSDFSSIGENRPGLPVHPDGTIYFPYLGNINVKGKTTLEVQQLLEKKINENIAEDCHVRVSLENRFYSIIGKAGVGRYAIPKEQMTIFQALAQSKDIQPYGDRTKVRIIRQVDTGTVIKSFDIRSRDIVNSEFYYVQPNDIIYVEPLSRQFWGISSLFSALAVTSTAMTIGFTLYNLIMK